MDSSKPISKGQIEDYISDATQAALDAITSTTNLGYTPSLTNGIVTSDTGTDATIPLADNTNAGLLTPAEKTKISNTSGVNTGDQNLTPYALLASPTFTGIPSAPTATVGTNTTQLATTAFVIENTIKTVRQINSATTLANSDVGLVIILTGSCTVTIPNGLMANFECTLVTLAGATLTLALGGSVALLNNTGTTMAEKLSFTLKNTLTANQYLTVGNL